MWHFINIKKNSGTFLHMKLEVCHFIKITKLIKIENRENKADEVKVN